MAKTGRIGIVLIFLGAFCAFAYARGSSYGVGNDFNSMPGPQLLSPVTDDIDLAGKQALTFHWVRKDLGYTSNYDFRLYKGYSPVASTRILKMNVPAEKDFLEIDASQFEEGQVYTWMLVQVYFTGQKSDKSFSSFQVIKK